MSGTEQGDDKANAAADAPQLPEAQPRAEFHAAADALRSHLESLPKAAVAVLPSPRRVEPRRPTPIAAAMDTMPEAASDASETLPGKPSEPVLEATPAPDQDFSPKEPPMVAHRLGAGNASSDLEPAPPPALRARRRRQEKAKAGEAQTPTRNTKQRRPLLRELGYLCVSLGSAGAIAGLAFAFLVIAPWPEEGADLWAVNRLPAIVIEDRNGVEVAARGARYGEAAAVADLPPYLVKAFLATEDRRFYEHGGVDFRGTLRAVIANLKANDRGEGGSTITQQLARNLFLDFEKTYSRKAKEAMLAFWLEGRYSKDEILSLYLNRIYFGGGAYGVESAAKTYFSKSARDVTLAEAAMLAGLPKSPSTLAPTLNPLGAQDRATDVIANLRETGDITEFEAREALKRPAVVSSGVDNAGVGWFFDYVAETARAVAGPANYDIVVRTTLDQKLQRDAEAAIRSVLTVDAKVDGALQAALIAYDNDGALRAMVGGRSYLESQFNRATQAKRQPGSAFKPIVYAAGFENGLTPQSRLVDQPINIAGWKPENYDKTYRGSMRLSEAVSRSINTIAVQVSEKVGRPKVIQMARRLGISSEIPTGEAGIALGGFSASLEELTAAYLPFADGGLGVRPFAIEEIADGRGKVLFTRSARAPAAVLDKKVAENMTHVLYQVMTSGTGRRASLGNRQAAGKTGTTNDWRDAWFIGYTAQMTAGVWVGNDDFQPMDKVTGGTLPASIWKNFMTAAHQDLPRKPLAGAYPAATYSEGGRLLSFYRDVLDGFRRVRRDGE
ncbi:MAG: PBP1A family penicillin-binding protein [Parvularculaceae bacterium]|nr:PBP1A family penicillin-binding protein [Parvularculaceae bacterium]